MTFSPFTGFDPLDGADPRVTLSRSNPTRTSAPACATCNLTICDHTDTEWNSASRTPEAADDGRANPRGAPVNAGGEGGDRDHGRSK